MANEIEATIGSLIFNGWTPGNVAIPVFLLKNAGKLLQTPSLRRSSSQFQGNHGIFDAISLYNERELPFEGEIHAANQSGRRTMQKAIEDAVSLPADQNFTTADGYVLVLFTNEDNLDLQAYAKIDSEISFDIIDTAMPESREFKFDMIADDPRLYSQTLHSESGVESVIGGVVHIENTLPVMIENTSPVHVLTVQLVLTVSNAGNFGAPPIIRVTGPTDGPVVKNETTGKFIDLDGLVLAAGEYVDIDVSASPKTILKNDGTDQSGFLTGDSDWIFLQPGSNTISLLDDTPAALQATLRVQWRDTWISA